MKDEIAKYICEDHVLIGVKKFYKIAFLKDHNMWGRKRPITERTFNKHQQCGDTTEYRIVKEVAEKYCQPLLEDLDILIDLSLQTKDEAWFMQLTEARNKILTARKNGGNTMSNKPSSNIGEYK